MTVIVAVHDKETWLGCDTQGTYGSVASYQCHKWSLANRRALGLAGDLRASNLVEKHRGQLLKSADPFNVATHLRQIMGADGYERTQNENVASFGCVALFATTKGVWSICPGFSIEKVGAWAGGSAQEIALGVLYATRHLPPEQRVSVAIEAAIKHDIYCGGEIWTRRL